MIKTLLFTVVLIFAVIPLISAPPDPHTFVPNRGMKPSQMMAADMKMHISNGVRNVIYIWNRDYSDPSRQIMDLLRLFKGLSDAPLLPKQMLMNSEFELYRVLDTKRMIKVLDRFQKDANQTYRALFEYMNLIIGSKQGSMEMAHKRVLKEMGRMVESYIVLAKETNRQYRQKVMPYYKLNYKK